MKLKAQIGKYFHIPSLYDHLALLAFIIAEYRDK